MDLTDLLKYEELKILGLINKAKCDIISTKTDTESTNKRMDEGIVRSTNKNKLRFSNSLLDKASSRPKTLQRDKEGYLIILRGILLSENEVGICTQ